MLNTAEYTANRSRKGGISGICGFGSKDPKPEGITSPRRTAINPITHETYHAIDQAASHSAVKHHEREPRHSADDEYHATHTQSEGELYESPGRYVRESIPPTADMRFVTDYDADVARDTRYTHDRTCEVSSPKHRVEDDHLDLGYPHSTGRVGAAGGMALYSPDQAPNHPSSAWITPHSVGNADNSDPKQKPSPCGLSSEQMNRSKTGKRRYAASNQSSQIF